MLLKQEGHTPEAAPRAKLKRSGGRHGSAPTVPAADEALGIGTTFMINHQLTSGEVGGRTARLEAVQAFFREKRRRERLEQQQQRETLALLAEASYAAPRSSSGDNNGNSSGPHSLSRGAGGGATTYSSGGGPGSLTRPKLVSAMARKRSNGVAALILHSAVQEQQQQRQAGARRSLRPKTVRPRTRPPRGRTAAGGLGTSRPTRAARTTRAAAGNRLPLCAHALPQRLRDAVQAVRCCVCDATERRRLARRGCDARETREQLCGRSCTAAAAEVAHGVGKMPQILLVVNATVLLDVVLELQPHELFLVQQHAELLQHLAKRPGCHTAASIPVDLLERARHLLPLCLALRLELFLDLALDCRCCCCSGVHAAATTASIARLLDRVRDSIRGCNVVPRRDQRTGRVCATAAHHGSGTDTDRAVVRTVAREIAHAVQRLVRVATAVRVQELQVLDPAEHPVPFVVLVLEVGEEFARCRVVDNDI
ncbi:hypothetical protein PybrP1_008116 [[Pythium] brassicae (nom. inval.)]|nr:hypothetical protein PybrP1_008116 [[Pythium] brassicae (nom. inval.)]